MKHRPRAFWEALIDEFEQERLERKITHQEFVDRHSITLGAFHKWLYELRAEREESEPASLTFTEVELPSSSVLTRVMVGAVSVEFDSIPPAAWVTELAFRCGGQPC